MNFYKRFPGDIQIKTGHLTMAEFGAYDRLLDHYYATEQPLPGDFDRVCSIARAMTKDDRKAVERVLAEFFQLGDDGRYMQRRADEMIAEAQPKIDAARANGKKGGRPKRNPSETDTKPTGFPDETQSTENEKASQSQSSSLRSASEANASGGRPPPVPVPVDPKDVVYALGVPLLTAAGVKESSARSFLAMRSKTHTEPVLAKALEACVAAKAVQPIPWIEARLGPSPKASGKHAGFAAKDYREGVTEDGILV